MSNISTATPKHIAIIMDGNGRWAKNRNLPRIEGHRKGVQNVELVVKLAKEIDLKYLTLYAFSSENWKRPKEEVDALMKLLEQFLKRKEKLLHEEKVRLGTIGVINALPEKVLRLLNEVKERTRQYDRTLTLALNYGSRLEVTEAVKAYVKAVQSGSVNPDELDWDTFSTYLDTKELPDPDLIIRTSGESRLSNFLMLQAAYSEIHYSPECWPDFGKEAFHRAIEDFQSRERRYGLTGDQIKGVNS